MSIDEKRLQLYDLAKRYGLLSEKTIKCSQELDMLINSIMKKNVDSNDA